MVSTQQSTESYQVVGEGGPPGDSGEDYDPEESSGPLAARRPKPRLSGKGAPKQKGKQCGGRRYVGRLSRLPDMPLDILYEVRIISVTDHRVYDDPFGIRRYSPLSVQWNYCRCRGPTRPFAAFSQASHRGRFGEPLSTMSPWLGGHLRVLRT